MYFTIHSEHITGKVEDHPLALSSPTSPRYIPLLGYVRGSPLPGWFKLFHLQAVGYPWSAPALPPDRLWKSVVVLKVGLRCHCFYLPNEEGEEGEDGEEEEIWGRN